MTLSKQRFKPIYDESFAVYSECRKSRFILEKLVCTSPHYLLYWPLRANFVDSCMRGTVRDRREMHVISLIVNRWPCSRCRKMLHVKVKIPHRFYHPICLISLVRVLPSETKLKILSPLFIFRCVTGLSFCSSLKEEKRFQKQLTNSKIVYWTLFGLFH